MAPIGWVFQLGFDRARIEKRFGNLHEFFRFVQRCVEDAKDLQSWGLARKLSSYLDDLIDWEHELEARRTRGVSQTYRFMEYAELYGSALRRVR